MAENPTGIQKAKRRTARRKAVLAAASLLSLGLPGCQSIQVNAANVASLHVIDASQDYGGYDLFANKAGVAYNIGYGLKTTLISMAPGTYTLTADPSNTGTVVSSTVASLANMRQYTALIGESTYGLGPQLQVLLDQNTPAASGQIAVRLVDEATKAGPVDIYLVPSTGKLTTTNPVYTGLTLGTITTYLSIPAGTYAIAVLPAGTVPVASSSTLLTGSQVGYASGAVRTIVFYDQQLVNQPPVASVVDDDFDPAGTSS